MPVVIFVLGILFVVAAIYANEAVASTPSGGPPVNDGTGAALLDTRGFRNNNPGNLRYIPIPGAFNGQIGDDGSGYGVYDTLSNGVRAAGKELDRYIERGLTTIDSIISTWAPRSENDTAAYRADVSERMNRDPSVALAWPDDKHALVDAIFIHENGSNPIDPFTLDLYLNS